MPDQAGAAASHEVAAAPHENSSSVRLAQLLDRQVPVDASQYAQLFGSALSA